MKKKKVIGYTLFITLSALIAFVLINSIEIQVRLFHDNPEFREMVSNKESEGYLYYKNLGERISVYKKENRNKRSIKEKEQREKQDNKYLVSELSKAIRNQEYTLVDSLIDLGAVIGDRSLVKLCENQDSLRVVRIVYNSKRYLPYGDYSNSITEMSKNKWFSIVQDFLDCNPRFGHRNSSCFSSHTAPYYYAVLYDNYETLQKLIAVNGTEFDFDLSIAAQRQYYYDSYEFSNLDYAITAANDDKMFRYLLANGAKVGSTQTSILYDSKDFNKLKILYKENEYGILSASTKYLSENDNLIDILAKDIGYEFSNKEYLSFKKSGYLKSANKIFSYLSEEEKKTSVQAPKSKEIKKRSFQILKELSYEEVVTFKDELERNSLMIEIISFPDLSIHELLESGVNMEEKDIYGRNAIFYSFIHGKQDELEYFLGHTLSSNITDKYGRTPLFYSPPEFMKSILESGCDLEHKDFDGRTAIMLNPNRYDLYKLGANVKVSDNEGYYPFHYNNFSIPYEGRFSNFAVVNEPKTNKVLYHRKVNLYKSPPIGSHYLVRNGSVNKHNLEFALKKGYDIENKDINGKTVLQLHAESLISATKVYSLINTNLPIEGSKLSQLYSVASDIHTINYLIESGANLDSVNEYGLTSREIIVGRGWTLTKDDLIDTSGFKRDVYDVPFE